MKTERLIGILSVLLQMDKVTAPYLAEKFEVSRRTINRDVEALCEAGIPIVTVRGAGGGISIMEGYRMDRTVLTAPEMHAILAGLKSLDSISDGNRYKQLMDKFQVGSSELLPANQHIFINLASWSAGRLTPKIKLLEEAIESRHRIRFRYYSPAGEGLREMDPYLLVFQWSSWYVWGYCRSREQFRLFKLGRMEELSPEEETFEKREAPDFAGTNPVHFSGGPETEGPLFIRAVFAPSAKWRLIEDYGVGGFREREDGKLEVSFGWSERESLFSWLLSFRGQAELLEPAGLREKFGQMLREIARIYE